MTQTQPRTGQPCTCKRGQQRDNCPACEGTGWRIDFAKIRARTPDLDAFIRGAPLSYDGIAGAPYTATFRHDFGVSFLDIRNAKGSCIASPIVSEAEARSFALNIRRQPC